MRVCDVQRQKCYNWEDQYIQFAGMRCDVS